MMENKDKNRLPQDPMQRLWDYINGLSEETEKIQVEKLIAENEDWKRMYKELMEEHATIHLIEFEQPSMRFKTSVMEEISKYKVSPPAQSYINKNIIRALFILFIILITGVLIFGLSQADWSGDISPQQLSWVNRLDISHFFTGNFITVVMIVNILLGLMLLDRFLNNRKQKETKI